LTFTNQTDWSRINRSTVKLAGIYQPQIAGGQIDRNLLLVADV
jgi:hypothetical protein